MRIEEYFRPVRQSIDACLWVQTSRIEFDQRATYQGFLRGEIYFVNGSVLHMREYVDSEPSVDRLAYSYQYMNSGQRLVFRYDNTGHHQKLKLPTYPHHKHDGSEENVVPSPAPTLQRILVEVGMHIDFPPGLEEA